MHGDRYNVISFIKQNCCTMIMNSRRQKQCKNPMMSVIGDRLSWTAEDLRVGPQDQKGSRGHQGVGDWWVEGYRPANRGLHKGPSGT